MKLVYEQCSAANGHVVALYMNVGFSHTMPYKVVTSLKETGQYENTIIVVTTDNGGAVKVGGNNLPLRGTKGQSKISFQVPSACASMQAPHGMAV